MTLCTYCGKPTVADDYGEYCDECLAYMGAKIAEVEQYMKDHPEIADKAPVINLSGQDAILSLNISPHQHDDDIPRSLHRFHLDDDTGPAEPYLGDELR